MTAKSDVLRAAQQDVQKMDSSITAIFKTVLGLTLHSPSLAPFAVKTLKWQRAAMDRRKWHEANGLHVPPILIASITRRCNLRCKGCYSHSFAEDASAGLPAAKLAQTLAEADELGISMVLIAGGEPFVRPDFLKATRRFRNIIFPVFTNGLLFTDEIVAELARQKNVIPVLSIEGNELETDSRRGAGVYARITSAMRKLSDARIFFGLSLTVTDRNYALVTGEEFAASYESLGAKLFFYVEYVPVDDTHEGVIREEQRAALPARLAHLEARGRGLYIAFPGDEEKFGGCLAAGRGFVHLNPEGGLEPCPFAPYSDVNLHSMTLKEGLASPLFRKIREAPEQLREVEGGCALWSNAEWVQSLLL